MHVCCVREGAALSPLDPRVAVCAEQLEALLGCIGVGHIHGWMKHVPNTFQPSKDPGLAGTADAGRMAPPASTRISAWLKRA